MCQGLFSLRAFTTAVPWECSAFPSPLPPGGQLLLTVCSPLWAGVSDLPMCKWAPVPFSNPETLIALCNYVFVSLSCLHISSLPLIWVLREDRDSLIYTLIFINIHTQLGGWNVEEASRALITHSPSREAFSFSRWRHWSFLCPLVALHGQNWWPQMRRFHWRCSGLTRVTLKKKNPSLWWNKISNQDNIVFTGLLRKKKDSFLLSLSWIFWKF